jgi:hypothetical protein
MLSSCPLDSPAFRHQTSGTALRQPETIERNKRAEELMPRKKENPPGIPAILLGLSFLKELCWKKEIEEEDPVKTVHQGDQPCHCSPEHTFFRPGQSSNITRFRSRKGSECINEERKLVRTAHQGSSGEPPWDVSLIMPERSVIKLLQTCAQQKRSELRWKDCPPGTPAGPLPCRCSPGSSPSAGTAACSA